MVILLKTDLLQEKKGKAHAKPGELEYRLAGDAFQGRPDVNCR
ncbi:MAG: hypothetical protein RLO18_33255 [Gimesia chilikensis]